MTRTIKGVKMEVVTIDNGAPVVKEWHFQTPHKKEVDRLCKKLGILPNWATAKATEMLLELDDETFFQLAKVVKETESDYIEQ